MALVPVTFEEGVKRLTATEREAWCRGLCKDCGGFRAFYFDDDESYNYPAYYKCYYHNTTGNDFVREMNQYCSFFKPKEEKSCE